MGIVKCEKGHFYDDVKYDKCPHCSAAATGAASADQEEKTIAKIAGAKQRSSLAAFVAGNEERTISVFSKKGSFSPVVGWLVCIEGPERGRDYRLISGRNFVGRSHQMDVAIVDDPEISREKHCSVIFDPKAVRFTFAPGAGLSYVNQKEAVEPVTLAAYDEISFGKTKVQLVPYCKEGVEW